MTTMHSTMNMLSVPVQYPIKVIETAGRNTGWLAAASALGKRSDVDPPHLILVPECRFNEARFVEQVESIYRRLGHAVIVAAEAIRDEQDQIVGSTGQDKTNSAAQYLGQVIKQHLQMDTRVDQPGDLQWSSVSHVDRAEAYAVGREGVYAVLKGESDKMVTLARHDTSAYHCTTGLVELTKIVGKQRFLPGEYLNVNKTMITRAFYDYATPLLGDPLPDYPQLQLVKVE
jgi:ATP-dependent phosphofructokinase / diphosphate-dependent phosphofructokinase